MQKASQSGCVGVLLLALLIWPTLSAAADKDSPDATAAAPEPAPAGPAPKPNKRMFGVLPNYRSVESSVPFYVLTPRQKLSIAAHDSFDWPTFLITGAYAGMYQAENQNPAFGQGLQGYAKRYGTTLADQVIGNMMTEGFLPVLMHDDPRFFRSGNGTTGGRLKSALRQILITRADSGSWRFNAPEWLGNGIGVGVSNVYYTSSPRTIGSNMQRFGMQIGVDALSNVMKEFWPDIRQRFSKK